MMDFHASQPLKKIALNNLNCRKYLLKSNGNGLNWLRGLLLPHLWLLINDLLGVVSKRPHAVGPPALCELRLADVRAK